jgi:hypothetical protein
MKIMFVAFSLQYFKNVITRIVIFHVLRIVAMKYFNKNFLKELLCLSSLLNLTVLYQLHCLTMVN